MCPGVPNNFSSNSALYDNCIVQKIGSVKSLNSLNLIVEAEIEAATFPKSILDSWSKTYMLLIMTTQKDLQLPSWLLEKASSDALEFRNRHPNTKTLRVSPYNPSSYVEDLTKNDYTEALLLVRHYIKLTSDIFFSQLVGAKNIDLFMMTPSVSSPMGPGSDSEAIQITFGTLQTYLVDSSQFGFEPLLFQGIEKVYCYLPSMRGEDPDNRHLNQFFHCEMEMLGTLDEIQPIIESYIKSLASCLLSLEPIVSIMSIDYQVTKKALEDLSTTVRFPRIEFDEACKKLSESDKELEYLNTSSHGRDIRTAGELYLMKDQGTEPLWIQHYDRDRVAFYQKPLPADGDRVINADLLFPPLLPGSFGGEIVGAGQRQDNVEEMLASLQRQGLSPEPYKWYTELRMSKDYRTTSGFGLGIERFIAWSLGYESIRDVIFYPRLKNVATFP